MHLAPAAEIIAEGGNSFFQEISGIFFKTVCAPIIAVAENYHRHLGA